YPDADGGDLSPLPLQDLGTAGMEPPASMPDASLPGRTLVWSDEFEGAAGQAPDPSKWSFDVGGGGWGNQELEYSTARPQNIAHGTVHGPGYSGGNGITAARTVTGAPLSAGFHVYAIEWFANLIVFSVDGNSYFTLTPQQLPAGTQWVFDHPFGIILDLAVGGLYVGSPDGSTTFPQTLLVDYVRVYEP